MMKEKKNRDTFSKIEKDLTKISEAYISNIDYQKNEEFENIAEQLGRIINCYTDMAGQIFNGITRLLESLNLNFSNVEPKIKLVCEMMLENGFYPYKHMSINICNIVNTNNKNEIERILSNQVQISINDRKQYILRSLIKYNARIKEIYYLYDRRKYRLCVLAQINLISIIFNEHFGHTDFTEKQIVNKIKEVVNTEKVEHNYTQFIAYTIDEGKTKDSIEYKNKLIANYRRTPEKYNEYPYNRNAILHGYSKDFGKKIHCLRWFSVLLNTVDLLNICGFTDELGE